MKRYAYLRVDSAGAFTNGKCVTVSNASLRNIKEHHWVLDVSHASTTSLFLGVLYISASLAISSIWMVRSACSLIQQSCGAIQQ